MSALKLKAREMLAAHRARSKPPAATGTAIGDTIAKLRTDLESHHQRAAEINRLIGQLVSYAGAEEFPSAILPVTARKRHAGGRPVIDPSDAQRAKKRDAMRRRRQRLRDAAAAAAAAVPPASPVAKPQKRQRQKAAPAGEQKAETTTDTPPAANGTAKPRRRKRRLSPPAGGFHHPLSAGVKGEITEWQTDENGCLGRELRTPGETLLLKGERLPAT